MASEKEKEKRKRHVKEIKNIQYQYRNYKMNNHGQISKYDVWHRIQKYFFTNLHIGQPIIAKSLSFYIWI